MLNRRRNLVGFLLAAMFLLAAYPVMAAEFSATVITKAEGQEMPGKIFMKGQKIRNEFDQHRATGQKACLDGHAG
jgi:hypothetical protein